MRAIREYKRQLKIMLNKFKTNPNEETTTFKHISFATGP